MREPDLDRRQVLRWGALLGLSVMGAPVLAGCSTDETLAGPGNASGSASSAALSGKLAPFSPAAPSGSKPGLPAIIAHANLVKAEFFQRVSTGMQAGAKDFGLRLLEASAEGDVSKNVDQMRSFLQRGVGALATHPIQPEAQAPVLEQAIKRGVCVIGNVITPATCHDVASQYQIGYKQGEAAAKYINDNLGGEAQVLYFNSDKIEALKPRAQGAREALKAAPGARIVVDQQPTTTTQDGGFALANTALQAHPDINVVLGGDVWVLGALAAFEAEGKKTDGLYFSGVDGEAQALDRVKQEGPYKASFAWPMEPLAYAWVKFAADWLQGKSIPKVIGLGVVEINSKQVADRFATDMANPKAVWETHPALKYLGNIKYDDRDTYSRQLYSLD